ncbi:MAG: DUF1592 domain-containing protein [Blastocatellia bacterium]|nr:DUF1592 domain-containing protein [Blastocatellia bacterium]
MHRRLRVTILVLLFGCGVRVWWGVEAGAGEPAEAELARRFERTVRPFLKAYCADCHSGAAPAAGLDLERYGTLEAVAGDFAPWSQALRKLTAQEMPPREASQPPDGLRREVVAWIDAVRRHEIRKRQGDPGPAPARRLSHAEYNYTIRDLTGVDLRPAREFPLDPTNQAGFDNSSESLTLSPALLTKYLDAARRVADHLVLGPEGLAFAPHPMLAEPDRERYSIHRILEFYDRQPTDFADYFEAAWRYRHRARLGRPGATLDRIAAEQKVSPRYLAMIRQALEEAREEIGPLAKLQAMWRQLPVPRRDQRELARPGCERMRDFVVRIRRHTERLFPTLESPGFDTNFQPIMMYRNALLAAHRRDFDRTALRVEGEPPPGKFVVTQGPMFLTRDEKKALDEAVAAYTKERREDPDLVVPAAQRERYEAAFARFSRIFPTAFYLRERGRFYPIASIDRERYLGAGLHNRMGYFRDDAPLSELILDAEGRRELEARWLEFEFIAEYTLRNYQQFIDFGASVLTVNRGEHKGLATEEVLFAVRDRYLAQTTPETDPRILEAIRRYFENANTRLRLIEKTRREAEPRHLAALLQFAARAYRRPLAEAERDEILAGYRQFREQNRLSHEEAMRASIAGLLVSPSFLYRVDIADAGAKSIAGAGAAYRPLSAYSLASRLSYFLWSSMPDEELLAHAAAGDLARPAVLTAQVRRMLKDPRVRGMATEFAGHWLDFRRFEDHNAVDRERFPGFTNQLREAMFEEPIRFLVDLLQRDLPATELLYGRHTFVNGALARHYGMPAPAGPEAWVRVDDAGRYGRGGLLPMAVFLTRNAPGLRTSPVKRGYWVARRVLGDAIPPPPPAVPELPRDEAKANLSVRELLVKHRENRACAACHARFDSFGLAFEGYGPVGERRTHDLAGRAADARVAFPDGSQGIGIEGLQAYIRARRETDFLDALSAGLLAFALGRSLQLSDEPLLEAMRARLAAGETRLSPMIETIVASPQFLNKRIPGTAQANEASRKKGTRP